MCWSTQPWQQTSLGHGQEQAEQPAPRQVAPAAPCRELQAARQGDAESCGFFCSTQKEDNVTAAVSIWRLGQRKTWRGITHTTPEPSCTSPCHPHPSAPEDVPQAAARRCTAVPSQHPATHSVATLKQAPERHSTAQQRLAHCANPVLLSQLLPAAHRGRLPEDSGHRQGWDCSPAPGMAQEHPHPATPARGAAPCLPHPPLGPSEPS